MEKIIEKAIVVGFPADQFVREFTEKRQIVIHHTVSGKGVEGDIGWWLKDPRKVATHFIIDREGGIWQLYSDHFWGAHLGVKGKPELDKYSIAIELDSWGPLMQTSKGLWYPVRYDEKKKKYLPNNFCASVRESDIQFYPEGFRGFKAFEKYTNPQLASLKELIRYFANKWTISVAYNSDMWDVNERALSGQNGVWTHVSFRKDKSDCHPSKELISILSSL